MKKWMVGLVAVVLLGSMASVWAEDGEGEKAKERKGNAQGEAKRGEGRRGHEDREGMMAAADKDKDGKVTLEEFTAMHLERMKAMFEKMDVNKDGVISAEDRTEARAAEGGKKLEGAKERKPDEDKDRKEGDNDKE